ncbi:hypothetical protein [Paenibacillus sp. FSL L8-0708]|uniref:hypothetical protein n=1 Tax=Paenibacillus sp. FSL L8-0708 TaxID=2975311 RepID=UPI0030F57810
MKKYECTDSFSIDKCDGDGFTIEESGVFIDRGSKWLDCEEDYRLLGGEIRLENEDGTWIELSKEDVSERFKEIV